MKKLIKNACWVLAYLIAFITTAYYDSVGVVIFFATFVLDLISFYDGLFTIHGVFGLHPPKDEPTKDLPPKELINALNGIQNEVQKAIGVLDKEIEDERKNQKAVK